MRILLAFISMSLLPLTADGIDVLAISPQKTWQIQRRQIGDLAGGDPEFIDFVNLRSGKIVFSFASIRRSADAEWSPDGSMVAINDRIATSGDFFYIFRVTNEQVILIRAPGDDVLTSALRAVYGRLKSTGRFTVTGRKWLDNSTLAIRVSGGGYGDDSTFVSDVDVDDQGRVHLDGESLKRLFKTEGVATP